MLKALVGMMHETVSSPPSAEVASARLSARRRPSVATISMRLPTRLSSTPLIAYRVFSRAVAKMVRAIISPSGPDWMVRTVLALPSATTAWKSGIAGNSETGYPTRRK